MKMPNYALERAVKRCGSRRSLEERFYARGALERFRAARSMRTLGNLGRSR
jgi:hypothetical protein